MSLEEYRVDSLLKSGKYNYKFNVDVGIDDRM